MDLNNVTVIEALNIHLGNSKITYKSRPGGRVELVDLTKGDPDHPLSVENGPLGDLPNASEDADPFAEPATAR